LPAVLDKSSIFDTPKGTVGNPLDTNPEALDNIAIKVQIACLRQEKEQLLKIRKINCLACNIAELQKEIQVDTCTEARSLLPDNPSTSSRDNSEDNRS
jgi:hypothetical protein